jgi:hydroxymethylbilane synthase
VPLHELGGKGLFVKELEQALLEGNVDLAVHSFKDLPVTQPLVDQSNLLIAEVPGRSDPRDVLISMRAKRIDQLPSGATVATGSLRRRCQLLARRPDLKIAPIRGNIDTRIGALRAGKFDATILAMAGIERAGLMDASIMYPVDSGEILCAAGQGALALQCRRDDAETLRIVRPLDELAARRCVEAERAVVAALRGDCHSPIAALATIENQKLHLRANVGGRDGNPPVISASGNSAESVVEQLFSQNAEALLHGQ